MSEQLTEETTRLNIVDVTSNTSPEPTIEDLPVIKPKTTDQPEGIFSNKGKNTKSFIKIVNFNKRLLLFPAGKSLYILELLPVVNFYDLIFA